MGESYFTFYIFVKVNIYKRDHIKVVFYMHHGGAFCHRQMIWDVVKILLGTIPSAQSFHLFVVHSFGGRNHSFSSCLLNNKEWLYFPHFVMVVINT